MNPFIVLGYTVPIKYDCAALTCPSTITMAPHETSDEDQHRDGFFKRKNETSIKCPLFYFVVRCVGLFSTTRLGTTSCLSFQTAVVTPFVQ